MSLVCKFEEILNMAGSLPWVGCMILRNATHTKNRTALEPHSHLNEIYDRRSNEM
jgi:hypothetical protein